MMGVEEFSEKLVDYGRGCSDVGLEMVDRAGKEDYNAVLIPSRGTIPIFLGALYGISIYGREGFRECEEFLERLKMPSFFASHLECMGLDDLIKKDYQGNRFALLLPFTADFTGKLEWGSEPIRKYWTKVMESFTLPPEKRHESREFCSFMKTLREVEKRKGLADIYESIPRVESFILIDTLISGKAAYEILKSFESMEMYPYTILVCDQRRERLRKPEYKAYLEGNGRVKMIDVDSLVTEDKGASYLGVYSVAYPDLMGKSMENGGFWAAESWILDWEIDSYSGQSFRKLMGALQKAIRKGIGVENSSLEDDVAEFLTHAKMERDLEDIKRYLNENVISPYFQDSFEIYRTKTGVLMVSFPEEKVRGFSL